MASNRGATPSSRCTGRRTWTIRRRCASCSARWRTLGRRASAPSSSHSVAGSSTFADRKSTRLNSSHTVISYAVFCLKKKKHTNQLQSHSALPCTHLPEETIVAHGKVASVSCPEQVIYNPLLTAQQFIVRREGVRAPTT